MLNARRMGMSLPAAAVLFLASVVIFACAVVGWLTSAELQSLLWPGDIHAALVAALGGESLQAEVGHQRSVLSLPSVMLRFVALGSVATCIIWFQGRSLSPADRRQTLVQFLRRSSIAMLAGAGWWPMRLLGEIGLASVEEFSARVLPLWVTLSIALIIWSWFEATLFENPSGLRREAVQSNFPFGIMMVCVIGWAGLSFWMNYCLYQNLLIPHGDSAMYEEHLWNIWHGKGFRSYLDQGLFLGEHIQVIHLLLLPLHMLWPSHLLLELAESIALASCSIPIYCIARRHTHCTSASALLGIAWLFYFPMHFLDIAIDQKTFRPIVLGLPFMFMMIDFAERRRFVAAFVFLLLALSAKEDIALITFPLMVVMGWLAWQQPRKDSATESDTLEHKSDVKAIRWCFGLAAFSAIYLIVAVLVVIPAFRAGDVVHYSRYFGDLGNSPGELIKTAITQPAKVLLQIFSLRTLMYGMIFLGPLAFLPLKRPTLLLAGGLTFVMLSLIQLSNGDTDLYPIPFHHFHAPLLPVLFWSAARSLGSSKTEQLKQVGVSSRALLILLCCMFSSLTGSLMPTGLTFWSTESPFGRTALFQPTDPVMIERAAMAQQVAQRIPATAKVASTDFIHTRLTHCERSYDYSDYLRAVNNYQKGVPPDTDYIVIDTGHRYSTIRRAEDVPELQSAQPEWRLLPDTTNGHFLILQRIP